jgi:hypothetical protein
LEEKENTRGNRVNKKVNLGTIRQREWLPTKVKTEHISQLSQNGNSNKLCEQGRKLLVPSAVVRRNLFSSFWTFAETRLRMNGSLVMV